MIPYRRESSFWFQTAKSLHEIHASEGWVSAGYETFKDYCLRESPEIHYPTILKFVRVMELMGRALEERLTKAPSGAFPGFTVCYEFVCAQSVVPTAITPKIRKDLIEGKITRRQLQETLEMALKVVSKEKREPQAKAEKPVKAVKEKPIKVVKAVPDEKKETTSAKAVKAEVVTAEKKDKVPANTSLLGEAREAYKNFQHSWFRFAKKLAEIQASNSWEGAGYESFKDYCLDEFPDVDYTTCVKFVRIIESMGKALEQRLDKAADKPFPGYTACYDFLCAQEKLPKDILPKIRKDLIEGKLTRKALADEVEPFLEKAAKQKERAAEKGRAAEAKKIDKAIEQDVKPKSKLAAVPVEAVKQSAAVDVEGDLKSDIEDQIQQLLDRVTYINDNLPLVTSAVSKSSVKVVKLAEALEKLVEHSDKYLDKASDVPA